MARSLRFIATRTGNSTENGEGDDHTGRDDARDSSRAVSVDPGKEKRIEHSAWGILQGSISRLCNVKTIQKSYTEERRDVADGIVLRNCEHDVADRTDASGGDDDDTVSTGPRADVGHKRSYDAAYEEYRDGVEVSGDGTRVAKSSATALLSH